MFSTHCLILRAILAAFDQNLTDNYLTVLPVKNHDPDPEPGPDL
jgi:hypothetical protein